MKLFLAIFTYVLAAAVLGGGLLMLVAGNPWLLIAGGLAYLIALSRIGCASH